MALHYYAARSLLPHFLALLYALAIVYASLQPFSPWIAPLPETPFFLFAPWSRWTRFGFDVLANMIAYAPFGMFAAVLKRHQSSSGRVLLALSLGAALSFAVETAQMYLPPRDASVVDLLSNTAGALVGGIVAVVFKRSQHASDALLRFRHRWFITGTVGDLGLALMAIWLAVQINPGIPLFTSTFDAGLRQGASAVDVPSADVASLLIESIHSAFQLLGVGLFLALLLRDRRYIGGAMLLLLGAALLVKGIAAAFLLKPAVWEHWMSPGVGAGVAVGTLLLLFTIWLPRPVQVALATVALLSSLLATLLIPDILFARAPLSAFNWSYGHLLNFNGLTHVVLLIWPVLASVFLFALAGRPEWGA
jgi:VanZ family protein